jgi:hypothetical protein
MTGTQHFSPYVYWAGAMLLVAQFMKLWQMFG